MVYCKGSPEMIATLCLPHTIPKDYYEVLLHFVQVLPLSSFSLSLPLSVLCLYFTQILIHYYRKDIVCWHVRKRELAENSNQISSFEFLAWNSKRIWSFWDF
jgi:hypothetical protein